MTWEILNAIFYVLRGDIAWRLMPEGLPLRSATSLTGARQAFTQINHHFIMVDLAHADLEASPTAAVIVRQSVTTTESRGPRGYDAGREVNGRKRKALVATDGRAFVLDLKLANAQNRDGAETVLRLSRLVFPFIAPAYADTGYPGEKPTTASVMTIEIVRKPPNQVGFAVRLRRG